MEEEKYDGDHYASVEVCEGFFKDYSSTADYSICFNEDISEQDCAKFKAASATRKVTGGHPKWN